MDDCNLLLEGIMYQMLERGETANDFEACVEQLIKENPLGCPHVFIQNIQNPAFAHLNGTFAVRGPCSPRKRRTAGSEVDVELKPHQISSSPLCCLRSISAL